MSLANRTVTQLEWLLRFLVFAAVVCLVQLLGNSALIALCMFGFVVFSAFAALQDQAMPLLFFFLPWSPMLKLSPDGYSFYTIAMVVICVVSLLRSGMRFRTQCLAAAIVLLALSLLSKIADGNLPALSYWMFMFLLALFPCAAKEMAGAVDFEILTVDFSVGILAAALSAKTLAACPNLAGYVNVYQWGTITRLSGYYGDANFYSAHITAALSGVLLLLLQANRLRSRLAYLGLGLLLLYCGLLSVSKAFALTAAAVFLVWSVLVLTARQPIGQKLGLLVGLAGAALLVGCANHFAELWDILAFRFEQAVDLNSLTTGRTALWLDYLAALTSDVKLALLGKGFTNVKLHGAASHNTLLQLLYQFGALGSMVLMAWLLFLYRDMAASPKAKVRKEHLWVMLIGVFLPWMSLDMLFFDEFFLLPVYVAMAAKHFSDPDSTGKCCGRGKGAVRAMQMQAEIKLERLIKAVWKKAWQVVLSSVLCAVLAVAGSLCLLTPQYRSSVLFYISSTSPRAAQENFSITSGEITAAKSLVESAAVILDTRETLNAVIDRAGVEREYEELQTMLSTGSVNSTEFFRVVVTSPDAAEAKCIADAIAEILPTKLSGIIQGASATVAEAAVQATRPSSPNLLRNALLGLLLGMLLSVSVVLLREIFDPTLRCEEDVIRAGGSPILATVSEKAVPSPDGAQAPKRAGLSEQNVWAASEGYRLLRIKLQASFAVQNRCTVLGIAGVGAGEEHGTTAECLAASLALSDRRVLLIDCDLRQLHPGETLPGLSGYLSGMSDFEPSIRPCPAQDGWHSFDLIRAGVPSAVPGELLSSCRMTEFLGRLRTRYDDILLKLPPVGKVWDAVAAAGQTDGILLVVHQNGCERTELACVVQQLDFVGANLFGVVYHCAPTAKQKRGHPGNHGKNKGCFAGGSVSSRHVRPNTEMKGKHKSLFAKRPNELWHKNGR